MVRMYREGILALALAALLTAAAGRSAAQAVIVTPPCEAAPAPVYYPPTVSYYPPATVSYYSPPVVSYYTPPTVSYYAPPTISYYAPPAYTGEAVTTYRRGILPWRRVVVTRYYGP